MMRVGTLFSGVGAPEHALERLRLPHHVVYAAECDKRARQQYTANFKVGYMYGDVNDVPDHAVDLIVGGPPCQAFSVAGDRKGLDDPRGQMIFKFSDIVRYQQPDMFLFENVPGLLSMDEGRVWKMLLKEFSGYSLFHKVLNAKDYGIPQSRRRVFLAGFRHDGGLDVPFEFPKPRPLELVVGDLLEDYVPGRYTLTGKRLAHVIKQAPRNRYVGLDNDVAICLTARQEGGWGGNYVSEKYVLSARARRFVMEGGHGKYGENPVLDRPIALALTATGYSQLHRAGCCNYLSDPRASGIRKLTPRECFRLMGFSDSYRIDVKDGPAYKQSGNSMVVNVVEAVLQAMFKYRGLM